MKRYGNRRGGAGVVAYVYGTDWICLRFIDGEIYTYAADRIGQAHLQQMKQLADAGEGLTTYINTHPAVKNGYTRSTPGEENCRAGSPSPTL